MNWYQREAYDNIKYWIKRMESTERSTKSKLYSSETTIELLENEFCAIMDNLKLMGAFIEYEEK